MTLEYRQPQPPEGINTSNEHPLKEFVLLLAAVLLFIVVIVVSFGFAAHLLAPFIPFSAEQRVANLLVSQFNDERVAPDDSAMTRYLQGLAERVALAQELPDGMTITVHYIDDEAVNAFATLGGHLFFFRGLLQNIPNENALAMVMAHEVAHVKYRHPIKSLGRGVVTGTAIAVVSSAAGGSVVGEVLGGTGLLTALKFSREQEKQADEVAMQALARLYGHVGGADLLFSLLQQLHKHEGEPPEFFSSHPLTVNRIENIGATASRRSWPVTGVITPLPSVFGDWLVHSGE